MFLSLSVCLYLSVCLSASVIHLITLKLVLFTRFSLTSYFNNSQFKSVIIVIIIIICQSTYLLNRVQRKKGKKRARKKENGMTINRKNRRFRLNGVFSLNGFLLSNGTQVGSFKHACLQQYHRYLYTIYIYIYIYIHIAKSCVVWNEMFSERYAPQSKRSLHHDLCMGLARKVTSSFEIEQKKIIREAYLFRFILIGCEKTISYFFFNNSFEIDCFYIKCDLFQRNRDEKKFFLFFLFFSFYFGIERNLIGRSVLKFST